MRKTAEKITSCFMRGETARMGNGSTNGRELFLFGNKIAEMKNGELWITDAGRMTSSTGRWLNELPGVMVNRKNGTWFLNGKEWNGEWINVETGEGEKSPKSLLATAALVAKMGDVLVAAEGEEAKNKWKKRMLATVPGIEFPEDWDSLSEEEKKKRLDAAIESGLTK